MISAASGVAGPSIRGEGPVAGAEAGAVGHPGGDLAPEGQEHRDQPVGRVEQGDLAEDVDHGGQLGPAQATKRRGS